MAEVKVSEIPEEGLSLSVKEDPAALDLSVGFLGKPFTVSALSAKVREVLDARDSNLGPG